MIRFDPLLNALVLEGDADTWIFDPEPGITPAQLALCLGPLLTGRAELVGALHPLALRHFRRQTASAPDRMHTVAPDATLLERTGPEMGVTEVFAELARLGNMTASEKLQELAAAGKRLGPEWTIIGTPFLVVGDAECGVCARLRNPEQP